MNKDIEQAVDNLRKLAGKYSRAERYYRGDHDLSFATEKFQNAFGLLFREFAMNLCPAIVDAVKDKLRVTGFSVEELGARASLPARGSDDWQAGSPRSGYWFSQIKFWTAYATLFIVETGVGSLTK